MRKLFASLITASAILSLATPALAADPNIAMAHGHAVSATLQLGVRLDLQMTYCAWLHEFALDKNIAASLKDNADRLAEARFAAYQLQSTNVKKGQVHLFGQESPNWDK